MIKRRYPMHRPGDITPKAGPVRVEKVHPDVWAKALYLAHGEVRRIKRKSEIEVWVVNKP